MNQYINKTMKYRIYKILEQDLLIADKKQRGGCSHYPIMFSETIAEDTTSKKTALESIKYLKKKWGGEYTFLPII